MKLSRLIFMLLFLYVSECLFSQTKERLKKQRAEIEKEINYTSELLNKTKSNKTKSLNYLKILQSQIENKEQLVASLNMEAALLGKKIKRTEKTILEIQKNITEEKENLKNLMDEYAKMIYAAFKQKGKRNNIMFILSATDFNEAYKRILYLKQYSSYRKSQAIKIERSKQEMIKKQERLVQHRDRLEEESATKIFLASSKKQEIESVNNIKKEKEALINGLSKSERSFKKQLEEKHKKAKALDDKIRSIIEEEIKKSKKKKENTNYVLTPEAHALSSEFKNNKGNLPWPLMKGVITSKYGKQQHLIFKGVETFNNGIDISTDENAEVRVVFDGIVSRIFFIKGKGKAVLINHGEYFSVYSGLKEVVVKAGEKLLSKEKIGVLLTNEEENKTELHFEIWQGYEKQDPSVWLYNAD